MKLQEIQQLILLHGVPEKFNLCRVVTVFLVAGKHPESSAANRAEDTAAILQQYSVPNVQNGAILRVSEVVA